MAASVLVAMVGAALAVAALGALILLSRRLGKTEAQLDEAHDDAEAFLRFKEVADAPLDDLSDSDVVDLIRNR